MTLKRHHCHVDQAMSSDVTKVVKIRMHRMRILQCEYRHSLYQSERNALV